MKRKASVAVAVAAIVVVTLASPASSRPTGDTLRGRIVPGKSIGPLRLGMSGAAATRILGRFGEPDVATRERPGTANAYVELEYPAFFSTYSIGLRGRRGQRRVVRIAAMTSANKTKEGIGRGTTERMLVRTYPGTRCRSHWEREARRYRRECVLGRRTERHTIFVMGLGVGVGNRPPEPNTVIRVVVTEPPRAGGPSGKGEHH